MNPNGSIACKCGQLLCRSVEHLVYFNVSAVQPAHSYSSHLLSISDLPTPLMKGPSVAHYQLGDLGIVPKPDQYIPTYFEKMRDATAVQQLGSLKKVLTRSVGVQTISTQKVGPPSDMVQKTTSRRRFRNKFATSTCHYPTSASYCFPVYCFLTHVFRQFILFLLASPIRDRYSGFSISICS